MTPRRHPRATHAPQRGTTVDYGEPGPPTYIDAPQRGAAVYFADEAEVTREQVAQVERQFAEQPALVAPACDPRDAADSPEDELLSEAVDEALGIERTDRLPLSPRSGPRLSAEATKRVGARLAQERVEGDLLRRAGLLEGERG